MSKDSSSKTDTNKKIQSVPWSPWKGIVAAVTVFIGAQLVAGFLISLVPIFLGWPEERAQDWIDHTLGVKLGFFIIANLLIISTVHYFLKLNKSGFDSIGFRRPKIVDLFYGLAAFLPYFVLLLLSLGLVGALFPDVNLNQKQQLGFDDNYGTGQLIMIGSILILLVPFTEEMVFRGLLYGSVKKAAGLVSAFIITSLLFAAGHLLQGGSEGLLYIAAIDTFVLSIVLIGLREITGGIWSSITLHAIKNSIAFVTVFVIHSF